MSYIPIVLNLKNRKVLIVGGGDIASNKLERVLNFTKNIEVISKDFSPRIVNLIENNSLSKVSRGYRRGDINGFDIVIVATNNISLQKNIFEESREKKILVNSVDEVEYCDFIFPSVIKKGDFLLSFSTFGSSPAFSKHIKIYFEKLIPDNIEDFLKTMRQLRCKIPKGKKRMAKFDKMAREFIENNFKH